MDWPIQPLQIQKRFSPRFCPRRECTAHRLPPNERFAFQRDGSYARKDGRRVPRFRCVVGNHSFSKQAFDPTYYLKRPELLVPVAAGLVAGSAHRQIARSLGCSHTTVTRMSARIGRHAMLLQVLALLHLDELREPLVADHLETFARSQDYPFGAATVVGQSSLFVYALDPAPHRRTGRTSPVQQARLRSLPRQETKGGYAASFTRAIDAVFRLVSPASASPVRLVTDGHEGYRHALSRARFRRTVRHEAHPNPKRGPKGSERSEEAKRRDRAMFANDTLHMLLRHTLAHLGRETIAFGRRLNAVMERLFLAATWRNFVKGVSERRCDRRTPAMLLGLADRPWSWSRVFARRLFPDRLPVPHAWSELYRRAWITPGGPNLPHTLARAF